MAVIEKKLILTGNMTILTNKQKKSTGKILQFNLRQNMSFEFDI